MSSTVLKMKSFIKETAPVRAFRRIQKKKKLISRESMDRAIRAFLSEEPAPVERARIEADMLDAAEKFGFDANEYFLLQLSGKSDSQRAAYISDFEHVFICEKLNKARNQAVFDDKAQTYRVFGRYYGRDCAFIAAGADTGRALAEFAQRHGRFIVKPVHLAGGKGIEILDTAVPDSVEKLAERICSRYRYGVFVEELIRQTEAMEKLHPASVNTVRVPTVRMDDGVLLFHPFLRVGRGDAFVDNAGSGGIICALDPDTGEVVAARDELGRSYPVHPDSGEKLVGFRVPRWEEAVALAKTLAGTIPTNRYTGWDLALTDEGWIMIEGNARGQFVWQYATLEGCRDEVDDILRRLGM